MYNLILKFKTLLNLIVLGTLFVFGTSSCLEVVSEVTIDEKGAGSHRLNMDFAKLMTSAIGAQVVGVEEVDKAAFQDYINKSLGGAMDSLPFYMNQIETVNNYEIGYEDYALVSSFDFDDLNEIASSEFEELNIFTSGLTIETEGKKQTLSWGVNGDKLNEAIMEGEDDPSSVMTMLRMVDAMVGGGKFVTEIHLPGKVKEVSDPERMTISDDKQHVTVAYDLYEILEGKAGNEFSITYK